MQNYLLVILHLYFEKIFLGKMSFAPIFYCCKNKLPKNSPESSEQNNSGSIETKIDEIQRKIS